MSNIMDIFRLIPWVQALQQAIGFEPLKGGGSFLLTPVQTNLTQYEKPM